MYALICVSRINFSVCLVLHDDSFVEDYPDEVPYNRIIEFVTGGPKKYAYKIARTDKDGHTSICKVSSGYHSPGL
jgi:hypothetical protein